MKYLTGCLLILSFTLLFGQKEGNIWYFGQHAGLDFNSGTPVPLTDGRLSVTEGTASIADRTTGKLLFYTDGDTVWDKTHAVMQNGTGLGGNKSTTQTAVIIPLPGSDTLYYVFAIDAAAGFTTGLYGGLAYNIIDISGNGGKGAVIVKNQPLVTPTTEKLCAIKHANGKDVWVMTHLWDSNSFYAYLLTENGLQTPIISSTGTVHTNIPGGWNNNYETLGYMKFSGNGKKLALAICNNINKLQLFDFDNTTGTVSNPITNDIAQPNSFVGPYGVCFSPDSKRLYLGVISATSANPSLVYQYDLAAGDSAAIIASRTLISTQPTNGIGALQVGPDGKIYVAKTDWNSFTSGSNYLDVIECPNAKGTACNYTTNAVFLGGSNVYQSTLGLPSIMENFLFTPDTATLSFASSCQSNSILSFPIATLNKSNSFLWHFNDPASGTADTSSQKKVSHTFSQGGTYTVQLVVSSTCTSDTFTQNINVVSNTNIPVINGPDTICQASPVTLHVSPATGGYQWQSSNTGLLFTDINAATDTTYSATISQTSYYRVYRQGAGSCSDTSGVFRVAVLPLPAPSLTAPVSIFCAGDSVLVCAPNGYTSYNWNNNGGTNNCTYAKNAGAYWVSVTDANGCSVISNRANMSVYPVSSVSLVAQGDTLYSFGATAYQWYYNGSKIDGATGSVYLPEQPGSYAVEATDINGCKALSTSVVYTSIENVNNETGFDIYPNPTGGLLNITYNANTQKDIKLSLYNVLGEKLMALDKKPTPTIQLDLSNYPKGLYLLQIQSGTYLYTHRVIVR